MRCSLQIRIQLKFPYSWDPGAHRHMNLVALPKEFDSSTLYGGWLLLRGVTFWPT